MWKKVLGGALALAGGVWLMALWVPQPTPPAWGDVWWWRNQLILLTGVRVGTITEAKISEFDLEAGVWAVPHERRKNRKHTEGANSG